MPEMPCNLHRERVSFPDQRHQLVPPTQRGIQSAYPQIGSSSDLSGRPCNLLFGTATRELMSLREWLLSEGCTHVTMESTGVYWKPIYAILEGAFEIVVANAQHVKKVPGRKSDMKDAEWIAYLLCNGLLRSSFVPPKPIRELRDLTRYRRKLVEVEALNRRTHFVR